MRLANGFLELACSVLLCGGELRRPRAIALLISSMVYGCGVDSSNTNTLLEVTQSEKVCMSCIRLEELERLGDEEEGAIFGVMFAAIDSSGNYWISQFDGPKVFAPDGSFIAKVGRDGSGPGEYSGAGAIHVDSAGLVYVVDGGNARQSIIILIFRCPDYVPSRP